MGVNLEIIEQNTYNKSNLETCKRDEHFSWFFFCFRFIFHSSFKYQFLLSFISTKRNYQQIGIRNGYLNWCCAVESPVAIIAGFAAVRQLRIAWITWNNTLAWFQHMPARFRFPSLMRLMEEEKEKQKMKSSESSHTHFTVLNLRFHCIWNNRPHNRRNRGK